MTREPCSGRQLLEMFTSGAVLLERNVQALNALNVFPVPDGDTGTNMHLTLKATLQEAEKCPDGAVGTMAQAMARGSLLGARGNSGVILSQFFRGLAQGLDGKEKASARDFALALDRASEAAYKGVSRPVEGTILTVLKEVAGAAQKASRRSDLPALVEAATQAAREAVARTPFQLPILREAGVVDAGGQGLALLLEGATHYLKGSAPPADLALVAPSGKTWGGGAEAGYGYCTEFLLQGQALDVEALRARIQELGESVLVVGDEKTVRVHLHTADPGAVLSYGVSQGTLHQVKVDNIDAQHRDFLALKGQAVGRVAVVAVVNGEGLAQVFRSLGATAIVAGGQTMNPSVGELLQAVTSVPQGEVIILPNNDNIVPTACQVQPLTQKRVAVIPTRGIPQGIAALLGLNPEAGLVANRQAMEETSRRVVSAEVTQAVRSMTLDGMTIRKGNAIGLIEGKLAVARPRTGEALWELLQKLGLGQGRLLTIYYDDEGRRRELDKVLASLAKQFPGQEVETVYGGQPHYPYLLSLD